MGHQKFLMAPKYRLFAWNKRSLYPALFSFYLLLHLLASLVDFWRNRMSGIQKLIDVHRRRTLRARGVLATAVLLQNILKPVSNFFIVVVRNDVKISLLEED